MNQPTLHLCLSPAYLLNNPNGKIPRNRFGGEPGSDKVITENINLGYIFEHQFNEQLRINHSLNYFRNEGTFNYTWLDGYLPEQSRIISRSFEERDEESKRFHHRYLY